MARIGLDLGSSYTKGVFVDDEGNIVARACAKTGYDFPAAARKVLAELSPHRPLADPVFTCGYGREQAGVPSVAQSEIIAVAAAVFRRCRRAAVILDIGGQDTKYIKITDAGAVDTFRLNKKCAAGTGAFLEEIAFRLGVPPEDFDALAHGATEEIRLNSFCTVFAVSEVIGLIKKGTPLPDIVLGIYNSIVGRAIELAPLASPLVLTGGIPAAHPMVVELFRRIHPDVEVPADAQFMAAHGAALLGTTTP